MKSAIRRVYEWEDGDGDVSIAWLHTLRHRYAMETRLLDQERPMLVIPYEQERNLKLDTELFAYVSPSAMNEGRIRECCGFLIKVVG